MNKPTFLYYDTLQYQPSTLKLIKENFDVVSLPDPNHDSDKILEKVHIAMAPLGFQFNRNKIEIMYSEALKRNAEVDYVIPFWGHSV